MSRISGSIDTIAGRFLIVCVSMSVMILSSCSHGQKGVNPALVLQIREYMSQKEVVALLGKPMHKKFEQYEDNSSAKAVVLGYKLDDGRTWVVVLNEHDQLIGSGEKDSGR